MATAELAELKPRKAPRQARSRATVDAIFEATVQVLLAMGHRRLTTTRVAERAGVSVGTIYQYFPNKQALLYAVLERELEQVADTIEAACRRLHGKRLAALGDGLVAAYVEAKTARPDISRALYLVADDLDTAELVSRISRRLHNAAAALLASTSDAAFDDLPAVTSTLLAVLAGSTRIVFERGGTPAQLRTLRAELAVMCRAYLRASAATTV